MSLPSQELYQLAHVATFLADALARRRHARQLRRWQADQDVSGGRAAYDQILGSPTPTRARDLPRPIDDATYQRARQIVTEGPREAEVVSLGEQGWAVVGQVPRVGRVGAVAASKLVAEAICQHLLTQPVEELTPWQVTGTADTMPKLEDSPDLVKFVSNLDPRRTRSRAVARSLRGAGPEIDAAIAARFPGVDLDAPFVVTPPADAQAQAKQGRPGKPAASSQKKTPPKRAPGPTPGTGSKARRRAAQPAAKKAASAPSQSAGP